MRTPHVGCLLAVTLSLLAPGLVNAQDVKWRSDYASARREAEAKGLPIVLDFGTANCVYCVKMDLTTFRDETVIKAMNEKFIPLKIDADREQALAQALNIRVYPTVVLAAPDGKILGHMEGYHDAGRFYETLQRAMAMVVNPDWMLRDYQAAVKARDKGEPGRAVALLRTILEDGKGRPVQLQADKMMKEMEQQAVARLNQAKVLHDKGQTAEAMDTLTVVVRDYAGTPPARDAAELLSVLAKNPEVQTARQARRAGELLAQAKKDFEARQFLACIERCETLTASYGDRPEAAEAMEMVTAIKNNPEWIATACESLSDRLGTLYLALAETWLKKGQAQQAVLCLERVVRVMPGSRHAEIAQVRLTQLRGDLMQSTTSQKQTFPER
jgi:thioredoxin-like negative regulator of GroEL